MKIPFLDLKSQYLSIKKEIDRIHLREKVITRFNLSVAKIRCKSGKAVLFNEKSIVKYCEQKGYRHRLYIKPIIVLIRRQAMLASYIQWLQDENPPSKHDQYKSVCRILDNKPTFKNAFNLKKSVEDELVSYGLTKEGKLPVEYTDEELINMYYKDVPIYALADLRLVSPPTMKKYLKGLGVDVRHKSERLRSKLKPELIKNIFIQPSIIQTFIQCKSLSK